MQRSPGGSDPLSSLLSILNSKEVRIISKHKVYSNSEPVAWIIFCHILRKRDDYRSSTQIVIQGRLLL